MFPGKHYDETTVGETFSSSLTVTETHLVMASGLFGDFNQDLDENETEVPDEGHKKAKES